ncbi:MAG: sensor domain-containing diguanylate cyclase [Nitrospiraceae bacterium]|nr:sensor domain-containing diguanylate cyclase [Nitrospiraceae bacterium]
MDKILFLIGEETHSLAKVLPVKKYKVRKIETVERAIPDVSEAAMMILDHGSRDSLKELLSSSKGIPKIIISREEKFTAISTKNHPLIYQLHKPNGKELLKTLKLAGEEKKLYDENRLLRERNSALEKEIRFFEDLSHCLTVEDGQTDVLLMLINKISQKTDADNCTIYLINTETGELAMEKTVGPLRSPGDWKDLSPPGEGIAGWVAREGKPVLIKSIYKDSRFSQKLDRHIRHKTKTLICMPIKSKSKILGVLELINKSGGREFTQGDFDAISRFIDYVAIVIERATLFEKMQELVITDDLTKLFNTRYMTRTIETEVLRSNRYHTSVSLIFMDIDYFKNVNDNYGHLVGSKVLVEMGQLLIRHLRELDIVARYGGDEFVVILPQTPPQRAVKTAERIRQTLEQHTFLKKEGYNLKLTASFGVASYPESAQSKEELIRFADEAMYKVKHRTRNGVYAIIGNGSV